MLESVGRVERSKVKITVGSSNSFAFGNSRGFAAPVGRNNLSIEALGMAMTMTTMTKYRDRATKPPSQQDHLRPTRIHTLHCKRGRENQDARDAIFSLILCSFSSLDSFCLRYFLPSAFHSSLLFLSPSSSSFLKGSSRMAA
jgi:hypothetical protein